MFACREYLALMEKLETARAKCAPTPERKERHLWNAAALRVALKTLKNAGVK